MPIRLKQNHRILRDDLPEALTTFKHARLGLNTIRITNLPTKWAFETFWHLIRSRWIGQNASSEKRVCYANSVRGILTWTGSYPQPPFCVNRIGMISC